MRFQDVEAGCSSHVVPLSNISGCVEVTRAAGLPGRRNALSTCGANSHLILCCATASACQVTIPTIEQVIVAETREGNAALWWIA